jgi:hypothetical protein
MVLMSKGRPPAAPVEDAAASLGVDTALLLVIDDSPASCERATASLEVVELAAVDAAAADSSVDEATDEISVELTAADSDDTALLLDAAEGAAVAAASVAIEELDADSARAVSEELEDSTTALDSAMALDSATAVNVDPDDSEASAKPVAEEAEATVATVMSVEATRDDIAVYDASWNGCAAFGCASKPPIGHRQ